MVGLIAGTVSWFDNRHSEDQNAAELASAKEAESQPDCAAFRDPARLPLITDTATLVHCFEVEHARYEAQRAELEVQPRDCGVLMPLLEQAHVMERGGKRCSCGCATTCDGCGWPPLGSGLPAGIGCLATPIWKRSCGTWRTT